VLFLAALVWAIASENPFAQGIQELAGFKHDQVILDRTVVVEPKLFRYNKFQLPEGSTNVSIVGHFESAAEQRHGADSKDSDNSIEVLVVSESAFAVWQHGYATSSVYESGRVNEGSIQADLPPGAGIYYLILSNKFSPKTPKSVTAAVSLRYKSWLPEWLRHFKARLWNWLGL
jgi:hypothetical protein